jgi:hypothetical protein
MAGSGALRVCGGVIGGEVGSGLLGADGFGQLNGLAGSMDAFWGVLE